MERKLRVALIFIITWLLSVLIPLYLDLSVTRDVLAVLLTLILGMSIFLAIFVGYFEVYVERERVQAISAGTPQDVVILNQSKTVLLNDPLKKTVRATETRILENCMRGPSDTYETFRFKLESSDAVPKSNEIRFVVDKEAKDLSRSQVFSMVRLICPDNCPLLLGGDPQEICSQCEEKCKYDRSYLDCKVPMSLGPGETKKLFWRYTSKAYEPAYDGKIDFMALTAQRTTHLMEFNVLLGKSMRGKFRLVKPSSLGPEKDFIVRDASNEEMSATERELVERKEKPDYKSKRIIWRIRFPSVGYKYLLRFAIRER